MPEGPTLRQLRYFLRAVETRSFSAAAIAESVAQPSLSEQIHRLERAVGAVLFTRSNRRLQLTDVGQLIVPFAEQTLRSAEDLASAARAARTLSGGLVSFGMFNSAHHYLLTPLIAEFTSMHPRVRIRIVGLNSSEVANSVRAGGLEAGLVQLPIDVHQLEVSPPVLTDQVVYVSTHPTRTERPVSMAELADRRLILSEAHWRGVDPLRQGLDARAAKAGVRIEPDIEVEYGTAALSLAAAGLGDTVASQFLVRLFKGSAVSWAPFDPPYLEQYAFIWRRGGVLSPATRRFMELARRHVDVVQKQIASLNN